MRHARSMARGQDGSLSGRRRRVWSPSRWPPSAAQTARAVFPHAAFTKTLASEMQSRVSTESSSINEWTFLAPVGLIQSTSLLGRECTGISLMELIHLPALAHLVFSFFPTAFAGCLPRPTAAAGRPVTRLSPRFRYYPAVRLLTERRSPLRSRL